MAKTTPLSALSNHSFAEVKHGTPSEFGDLSITFTVDFPQTIDPELAAGLEKLLPAFTAADLKINPP